MFFQELITNSHAIVELLDALRVVLHMIVDAFHLIGYILQFDLGRKQALYQGRQIGMETGAGGVAFFAHIGGFVAGAVVGWLLRVGGRTPAVRGRVG